MIRQPLELHTHIDGQNSVLKKFINCNDYPTKKKKHTKKEKEKTSTY